MLIPNTVAILKGAPHPGEAKKFVDALLQPEIEEMLAESTAQQWPVRSGIPTPSGMGTLEEMKSTDLTYEQVSESVDRALEIARETVLGP